MPNKINNNKNEDLVYAKMTRSQYNEFVKYLKLKKKNDVKKQDRKIVKSEYKKSVNLGKPPIHRKTRVANMNNERSVQKITSKGICKKNIISQIQNNNKKNVNINNLERIPSKVQYKQSKSNFNQNYENIFQQRQSEINSTYYNTLEKHGDIRKTSMEFMSRQKHMNNLKNTRANDFKKEIKTFHENVDPYKLLDVDDTMTLKQVSKKYKKLAMIHHPDKGGNSDAFTALTKAYLSVCEKIKEKNNNRGFQDLKMDDRGEVNVDNTKAPLGHGEKFNINLFNDIYSRNKLHDPNKDSGYGEWMKNNSLDENKNDENLFTDKFNIDIFNSVFNNLRSNERESQVQKYSDPMPLVSSKELYTELGADPHDINFTKNKSIGSSDLGFCDYKMAMTSPLLINKNLNSKKIKEGKLKSVEEIEKERDGVSYTMDDSQLAVYNRNKILEKERELNRLNRIKQNDSKIRDHHNKLSKALENTKNQFLIN